MACSIGFFAAWKRAVAAVLTFALLPQLTGCVVRVEEPVSLAKLAPAERAWLERGPAIVGVRTLDDSLTFDSVPPPSYSRDSVVASVGGRRVAVARGSVRGVLVQYPGQPAYATGRPDFATVLGHRGPIGGLTTTTGIAVPFDRRAPARIVQDTLFALSRDTTSRTALADVRSLWVERPDIPSSILVTAAAVTAVAALFAVVTFALSGGFHLTGCLCGAVRQAPPSVR